MSEGSPRLTLAALVDLELLLEADRERPIEALHARDDPIARVLDVPALGDSALVLGWLGQVRAREQLASGLRFEAFLRLLTLAAVTLGAGLGAASVAGWLLAVARPVNVIHFWSLLAGVPLLLALGFVLASSGLLATLDLVERGRDSLTGFGVLIPNALAAGLRGLGESRDLARVLDLARRLDWLYGELRYWRLATLSQTFALAFHGAALAALIAIPYTSDPAFGWRSRLLEPEDVRGAASFVALPWAWAIPEAVPSLSEVELTRYSSLDPTPGESYVEPAGARGHWAAWWPWLVASLALFGFAPRLVLFVVAASRARRALARVGLDHPGYARLRERLRQVRVDTRGEPDPETGRGEPSSPSPPRVELGSRPVFAFRFAGATIERAELSARLERELGLALLDVRTVGGASVDGDAQAIAEAPDGEVATLALVVPAFDPPVGEHLDLIAALRARAGPARPIAVLLDAPTSERSAPEAAKRALDIWRDRLSRLGDPWLRVELLPGPV